MRDTESANRTGERREAFQGSTKRKEATAVALVRGSTVLRCRVASFPINRRLTHYDWLASQLDYERFTTQNSAHIHRYESSRPLLMTRSYKFSFAPLWLKSESCGFENCDQYLLALASLNQYV